MTTKNGETDIVNKLVMFKVQLPYGQWYKAEHRQFIESLLNTDPDDAGVWEDKDKESDKYVLGMRQLNYSYIHDIVVDSENLARLSRFCRPIVMGSTTTTTNLGSFTQRVEPVLNERVQVVVPGPALSSYDRVMVL